MQRIRRFTQHIACVFGLLCLGCSSNNLVEVSGTVTIDGKPLTVGFVTLVPSNGRPAYGEIGPDGRFTLKPYNDQVGCPLGTHRVSVVAFEILSPTTQRWHAPIHYRDHETSELTATIDGPTDSLKIELTWAGGKPFIERTGVEGEKE